MNDIQRVRKTTSLERLKRRAVIFHLILSVLVLAPLASAIESTGGEGWQCPAAESEVGSCALSGCFGPQIEDTPENNAQTRCEEWFEEQQESCEPCKKRAERAETEKECQKVNRKTKCKDAMLVGDPEEPGEEPKCVPSCEPGSYAEEGCSAQNGTVVIDGIKTGNLVFYCASLNCTPSTVTCNPVDYSPVNTISTP